MRVCMSECATACMQPSEVKLGVSFHCYLFETEFLVQCCAHQASCSEASRGFYCFHFPSHWRSVLRLQMCTTVSSVLWGPELRVSHFLRKVFYPLSHFSNTKLYFSDNTHTGFGVTLHWSKYNITKVKTVYRVAENICKLCKRLICTTYKEQQLNNFAQFINGQSICIYISPQIYTNAHWIHGRCPTSLVVGGMQIKAIMKYHLTLTMRAFIKGVTKIRCS